MKECEFGIQCPERGLEIQRLDSPMTANLKAAGGFRKVTGFVATMALFAGAGCGGGGVINGSVLGSFEAKQYSHEPTPTPIPIPRHEPTPTTSYPNAGKFRSALDFTRDNGVCPSPKTVGEMDIPDPQARGGFCPGTGN